MEQSPEKSTKKPIIIKVTIGIVGVLLVGALGFMIWQNNELTKENNKLEQENANLQAEKEALTSTTKPTPAPIPETAFKPSAEMVENIKAVFDTMNTQPMEGYLADEVELYYASAEPATKLKDRVQIVGSLQYFSDAKTPWNFSLSKKEIAKYENKFDKLFGDGCLAGRSADGGQIVSLCFTKEGKIHSIFLCRDPKVFS